MRQIFDLLIPAGKELASSRRVTGMFWLKLVEVVVILTAGIFLIAFLEDTFVSAPRRRELKRKAREKIEGTTKQD
jgi:hypothetical protein